MRSAIAPLGRDDSPALVTDQQVLNHGELRSRVRDTAESLGGPRQVATIQAGRDIGTVIAYLGAMEAGHAVLLTADDHDRNGSRGSRTRDITATFRPGLSFVPSTGWESTGVAPTELHPDLALLLSTSGTTGSPKLVRLSRRNLASNAEAIVDYLGITADDRALATLPLHYCYGLSVLNSHLLAGAAVLLTEAGVVDPCCWDLAATAGATSFAGVPHTFTLLERRGIDCIPGSVGTITQAGGRMAPNSVRRWATLGRERGFDFVVMYGQTEATARMAWLPAELAVERPDAIGVPIPGGSFRLDDDELVYSGPNVMMGYAHSPAELSRGHDHAELHTGDLARQADDGLWEITGRRNRFAKPLGLRVDLAGLEESLAAAGTTAACVRLADDGSSESVGVLVETGAGSPTAERSSALANATHFTGLPPAAFVVASVEALPRNDAGKVDLTSVASVITAGAVGDSLGETAEACEANGEPAARGTGSGAAGDAGAGGTDAVVRVFAQSLAPASISGTDTFVDLGGDSLSYVEVSMGLEELLGQLPPDWHLRTVQELADLDTGGTPGRFARVEIGGVLRTIGILMVVSRHVQLTALGGGAHVLMALSGFNFSRFPLTASMRDGRYSRMFGAAMRVGVPTALWLAAVVLITGGYSWANVGFLNAVFGPDGWGDTWRYWYLEALVQILLAVALLFALPPVRRMTVRLPYALPMALAAVALTVRFGIIEWGHEYRQVNLATGVAWLFMLGWAAHRAQSVPRRLIVSAVALAALPGWFGDPVREVIIGVALLAIIWVREVPVPRFLAPVTGVIGGASMWIYLTHWQVYPPLQDTFHPGVLLALSVLTGVVAQKLWDRLAGRATGLWNSYRPSMRRSTRNEPVAETSSKRPLSSAGR